MSDANISAGPLPSNPLKRQPVKADKALLLSGLTVIEQLAHPPRLSTDTVKFLIPQRLDKARRTAIKQALMATGCTYVRWHKTDARQYRHRLEIQDPNDDTYRCLASLLPGNRFCGRDLAVDFLAITTEPLTARYMAEILADNVNFVATQKWRGQRKTKQYETTFYGSFTPKTSRNWRCYLARHGEPIVRFEAMYNGADLCKRRGCWTATDLIGSDLVEWLMQDFRISIISWKKFDNLIKRETGNIAAAKEQLLTEIHAAQKRPLLPGETLADLAVQDLLDSHPLLREAAEHASFFDLSASRARARMCAGQ